jgi:hypothetical protein
MKNYEYRISTCTMRELEDDCKLIEILQRDTSGEWEFVAIVGHRIITRKPVA